MIIRSYDATRVAKVEKATVAPAPKEVVTPVEEKKEAPKKKTTKKKK